MRRPARCRACAGLEIWAKSLGAAVAAAAFPATARLVRNYSGARPAGRRQRAQPGHSSVNLADSLGFSWKYFGFNAMVLPSQAVPAQVRLAGKSIFSWLATSEAHQTSPVSIFPAGYDLLLARRPAVTMSGGKVSYEWERPRYCGKGRARRPGSRRHHHRFPNCNRIGNIQLSSQDHCNSRNIGLTGKACKIFSFSMPHFLFHVSQ